jgi:DNA topoisomerase-1
MRLFIVESPAKARTLKKLLNDFVVASTIGHIKDLPKNKLGVDINNDFKPSYVFLPGKQKIIQKIKELAKPAKEIYLALDPDREGEAIAWHVAEEIGKKIKKPIKRVLLHEITPSSVKMALKKPTTLDFNKYASQQTRRILDRLVGYKISPLLWEKVKVGLSAGRVQSVALRLVCERERAIQSFIPKEYWEILALLEGKDPPAFEAKLVQINGERTDLKNEVEVKEVLKSLQDKEFFVNSVITRERRHYPLPPFITSTLQQEAAKKLGFSAQKTITLAQQLYEGVELEPQAHIGLITYMRTDSVRVAEPAMVEARKFIKEKWGNSFLPRNFYLYKNKKKVQDAHEAIRPTSVYRDPKAISSYLNKEQMALYELIWKRFIASQMTPVVYDQTVIDIKTSKYLFRASGSVLKKLGFKKIYQETKETKDGEEKEVQLPPLEKGQRLKLKEFRPSQHFSKPSPMYTEASLIKELEEKDIGRPSTYATILTTIQQRKYVKKEKKHFHPTELGLLINDLLIINFPQIFNISFTAKMEEELDEIEEGAKTSITILKEFYYLLSQVLEQAQRQMADIKKDGVKTEVYCEQCGSAMSIRYGKNGAFLSCSRYPECKNKKEFKRGDNGKIIIISKKVDESCPVCGATLVAKYGRYGPFLACSNYPKCEYTKAIEKGKDVLSEEKKCPQCGAQLTIRQGKKGGNFLGCSRYPDCLHTAPLTLGIKCPKCSKGELVQRVSKNGKIFYGCTRYPECQFLTWKLPSP